MRTSTLLVPALSLALLAPLAFLKAAEDSKVTEYFAYIGTYTRNTSKGIYAFRFNPSSGKLTPMGLAAETPSPSFLAVHPNGRFLYATNEREWEEKMGTMATAFAIDNNSGRISMLNRTPSRGDGPVHDTVDRTGKNLIVANYRGGSLAVLPIRPDGSLAEASAWDQHQPNTSGPADRQKPIVHGVAVSPDNRFVAAAENGMDEVRIYHFDAAKGTLTANETPLIKVGNDQAPRHLVFHPNSKFLYVLNEHGSTITTLAYTASSGAVRELQTISTLPPDFSGRSSTAQLQLDRTGKFLYASNRGHDSIAVFAVDASKGTISPVEYVPTGGKTPRDFSLDPTGGFLFVGNQASNNLVLFRVDQKTGRLTATGQVLDVPEPTCIVFAPVGKGGTN